VHFEAQAYQSLRDYLKDNFCSQVFVMVDSNTKEHCLSILIEKADLKDRIQIIEIEAGEKFKNLDTCRVVWDELSDLGGDRKSLLINLGGGVITDMGGFIASCFKRGIRFVNVPTTLLSMVDASVGGKTGVDLGVLKNQIGLFSSPEMVLIDMDYLSTVSDREMRSGLAEIIKYGYTFDKGLWEQIKTFEGIDLELIKPLVHRSIEIKNEVVLTDLHENGLRKTLNFGHTAGHAIESYFLENESKKQLTHGEAIAAGMVAELFYSSRTLGLPSDLAEELKRFVNRFYGTIDLRETDCEAIMALMAFDKKNVSGRINFVLLDTMEKCRIDQQLSPGLIREGLLYLAE
jgi:3-dehydroquinate synthase